ncbi:MAG TPA: helix-turn-helix domain-containing protein [Methanocella sp.]|nr:helix-turn-helix domain-containing protein [Methanocella sp.]
MATDVLDKLQKLGLTEYEARAYLYLLSDHMNSAAKLSKKSGVPRTKIYETLESLEAKGWIRIYSGVPLLFRAVDPRKVLEKIKKEQDGLLNVIQSELSAEAFEMKDKFIVLKMDIGLEGLKEEIAKAKTVHLSNATSDLVERLSGSFAADAEVKAVMFPGEKRPSKRIESREAMARIVCLVKNKETASTTVVLDEGRVFTVIRDPVSGKYRVDEMLHDDCAGCLNDLYHLGWNSAKEA